MEITNTILIFLLLLIIVYILWDKSGTEREKRLQTLLFNISALFLDTKDRRQNDNCFLLIEMLGSFLDAEYIMLKLNKAKREELTEFCWWKDKESYKPYDYEPGLILELKEKGEVLGTITIKGNIAVSKLKREKLIVAAYITKLINRFYEDDILYHMAYYDQLTNLPNRSHFLKLAEEANKAANKTNEMVAYLFFDLDAFKTVNDNLGHESGDELLKAVADRLSKNKNIFSIAARYGGDEYLIMLEHITKLEQVMWSADALMELFKKPFILSGRDISITASVGISLFPCHGSSVSELLVNADKAMYQSKAKGKNRYDITPLANG